MHAASERGVSVCKHICVDLSLSHVSQITIINSFLIESMSPKKCVTNVVTSVPAYRYLAAELRKEKGPESIQHSI